MNPDLNSPSLRNPLKNLHLNSRPSCASGPLPSARIPTPCFSSAWATSTSSSTTTPWWSAANCSSPSPPAIANAPSPCAASPITPSKATSPASSARATASPSATRWRTPSSPRRSCAAKSPACSPRAPRSTPAWARNRTISWPPTSNPRPAFGEPASTLKNHARPRSPSGDDIICAVALLDISTGEFRTAEFSGPAARQQAVDEILMAGTQ